MKFLTPLFALVLILSACQPAPPVTVECPEDATCDVNVTPPPMTPAQIQYHADQGDIAEDILIAMMIQDMTWRNCWDCYGGYYTRYPTLTTQRERYYSLPPQQRVEAVRTTNTTVINKNTTIIQEKSKADPPAVKAAPAKVSGQNGGTGGGNAATNKAPAPPPAPANNTTKPAAPPANTTSNTKPAAPAPPSNSTTSRPSAPSAPAPSAPRPSAPAPSAPSGRR